MRSAARPQLAKLINADEEDIALVESTTHGLNLVANAIPLQRGDRVIICDLEFLEVAVPWLQRRDEDRHRDRRPPESRRKAAGRRCRGCDHSRHSRRRRQFGAVEQRLSLRSRRALTPLPRPRRLSDRRCHSADRRRFRSMCEKTPVDALACGGHKWLMSPFGCGFLYLSKEFRAKVKAPLAGYLSVAEPEGRMGNVLRDAVHLAGRRLRICAFGAALGDWRHVELSGRDRAGRISRTDQRNRHRQRRRARALAHRSPHRRSAPGEDQGGHA